MKTKLFFSILLLTVFLSCKKDNQDISNKPDNLQYYQAFSSNSVFYNPIGDNPQIDPNSSVMVGSLIEQQESQGFLIAVKEWTVPVYFTDALTEKQDVSMSASWAPMKTLKNVPIPEYAEPDPSGDGHMVIIDETGGCIYDFWEMQLKSGGWQAGWGNALLLSGDGIFPKGLSARGSGFELLQGIIWPQELEAGEINHALIFSYDHTKAGGPVSPATESDGTSTDDWAIPEGALVQLDPALNLSALGLSDYEMTIAKALQVYGMYCADDGGGLSLYAINPLSCKTNPYENIWGNDIFVYLTKIPVDKFRILLLPQQNNTEATLVSNSCADFE
ncbi:MAG: hypothetical protein L3J35_08135 [Bacteroidales bacterium]|nr:hypothetical protein [Bacteroidales bacterium]